MIYLVISVLVFLVTIPVHIIIHRILLYFDSLSFKTVIVFLLGLIVDVVLVFSLYLSNREAVNIWNMPLPYTAVIFYLLLTAVYMIFYTSPFLGNISPSTEILLLLRRYKKMSYQKILSCFTGKELVLDRLKSLEEAKLIKYHQYRYTILPAGRRIVLFFVWFRKLLNWNRGG